MNDLPRCEICRKSMSKTQALNDDFIGFFCEECDLLATDTRQNDESIHEINRTLYGLENRILTYHLRKKEFQAIYDDIFRFVHRHHREDIGRVLEVGSNIGYFSNFVKNKGIFVETVEINETLRAYQQLAYGIPSYESLDRVDAGVTYDLVVMMDVLEHIPHPVEILQRLTPRLGNDGAIFIQSPNKDSLSAKIAGKRWSWWCAPDHLYHFSGKSLTLVARKAGFEVVSLRHISTVLDDVVNLPAVGRIFGPIRVLSRWVNMNPTVRFDRGSLIQALIRPARNDV